MSAISEWDDDYARLARAASQLRVSNTSSSFNQNLPLGTRDNQMSSLKTGLGRLTTQLRTIEQSRSLNSSEIARRRNLVDNLSRQVDAMGGGVGKTSAMGTGSSGYAGGGMGLGAQTQTQMALKQQDDMIDELAAGVGRLKDQSRMINDESKLHTKLLDEMDADVEKAHQGMENETRRAAKLKEETSVWRLYMIIAGLFLLLIILILTGLS